LIVDGRCRELSFGFLGLGRRLIRKRFMAAGERRIGERELAGDFRVLAVLGTESRGSSLGCAAAEIVTIVSHRALLLSVVDAAGSKF
jgi:hypothetical protein